ncbi:MAG: hypothetical protein LBD53_03955 [Tannerella sp.]|jgi:hypothetical protein|nr:hypothetical protein [Tannerella sp.]
MHRHIDYLVIALLAGIYILLPSNNPTGDIAAYAVNVREGSDLFMPHHLLYNAFNYAVAQIFGIYNTLILNQIINALFAVGCLLVMRALLRNTCGYVETSVLLLAMGSCYGFLRYAVSGETYIIPLFFSLQASLCALRYPNRAWLTGVLASTACLFHQIHVFWWAGLLIYIFISNRSKLPTAKYLLVSCMVPAVYLLVFNLFPGNSTGFFDFIFYEYFHNSNVSYNLGIRSLYLTPVNLVRTFFQVHGNMLPLVEKYPLLLAVAGVCIGLIVYNMLIYRRIFRHSEQHDTMFGKCHLMIFGLQLLFAAGSSGNAEFMVMLPFALVLFYTAHYQVKTAIAPFAVALLLWNISFAVIPSHFLEMTPEKAVVRYIERHPQETYCVFDLRTVENMLRYRNPARSFKLYEDVSKLDSLVSVGIRVGTDVWSPRHLSRATMLNTVAPYHVPTAIVTRDTVEYDIGILVMTNIKGNF